MILMATIAIESYGIEHFWPMAYKAAPTLWRQRIPAKLASFNFSIEIKDALPTTKGVSLAHYRVINNNTVWFYRRIVLDRTPGKFGNAVPFHGIVSMEKASAVVKYKPRGGFLVIGLGWALGPALLCLKSRSGLWLGAPFSMLFLTVVVWGLWRSLSESKKTAKEILDKETEIGATD